MGTPRRWLAFVLLALSLVLLLIHAHAYQFLTDDAFISFRYARNLSHGFGLVFNPGSEHVEGYSNFLWVLVLAALDRLGVPPERAAPALGYTLTVGLWMLVVGFAWRYRPPRHAWLVAVPALLLASTRSVAVWSTSGLETRFFEVCIVAALLRLVVEIEALLAGEARAPLAPWLFVLGSLTRPEGLLLSASALVLAALVLLGRGRRSELGPFMRGWLPWVVLVAAHFAFRRWYYHEWLPNTYYAKVGGQFGWSEGGRYAAAFALEYGAYLWVPLLIAAVLLHRRRDTGYVPILLGLSLVPHLLSVIAIGGDHFEYRPLDLYFPLVFLLLYDGAKQWIGHRGGSVLVPLVLVLILAGLVELPWQSHRQFPARYVSGFPGMPEERDPTLTFLDPEQDPLYRWPGLRSIAGAHRALLVRLTDHFVGIRQEEHRLFLESALIQGQRLRRLLEEAILPRDIRIAVDCVGAIPYLSGAWTLDRLGLTDRRVAHSGFVRGLMAHGKAATIGYARERGVDLWSLDPVHPVCPLTSMRLLTALRDARRPDAVASQPDRAYAADVGDGTWVLALMPQGIESARRRMPRLDFAALDDSTLTTRFITEAIPAYLDSLRASPNDFGLAKRLAFISLVGGRYAMARDIYQRLSQIVPNEPDLFENLSLCQENLGDLVGAVSSLRRTLELVQRSGDEVRIRELRMRLNRDLERLTR